MSEPGWKSERAVQANIVYAISLLNEGTLPEAVQANLVERGLSEDDAAGVVGNLLTQAIYTDAVDMLNRGIDAEQVKQQLAAKGLEHQTASAVVGDILEQSRRLLQEQERVRGELPGQESVQGVLLKLLGGAVFVVGVVLFFGNITGAFPTFRYAGYAVMGIGSFIWALSEAW